MLTGARFTGVVLNILALTAVLAVSCEEAERHEVLTFFFDGVPPLGGEVETEVVVDPNSKQRRRRRRPKDVWFVHDPQKECSTCHGERKQTTWISAQIQLVTEVPELCYGCHEEFASLKGRVHGPVANGICLFCHDPHKTRNEHLLRRPVPQLCYACHNVEVIAAMGQHCTEPYSKCNDCHDGHASLERYLLKEDWENKIAGAGEPNSLAEPPGQ